MMFRNIIFIFVLSLLSASPAFVQRSYAAAEGDPCCPETTSIRPAIGGERIAPVSPMPARALDPIRSLAKPDAVIVPGYTAAAYPNVADMIVGRVAGVMVSGGGFNNYVVRIRGAMGPPLIVLDGIPFQQANNDRAFNSVLQMIPTAEVASIEILKSIAETAIYGGQAANGVIRINTKGYLHSRD